MPKKSITKLYAEFERGVGLLGHPRNLTSMDPEQYHAVLTKVDDLAERIIATRADSVAEMLLKIAVGGWWNGTIEPLNEWTEVSELGISECLVSIRKDLQAM